MPEPMIVVRDLRKSFGATEVLKSISLTIERGEVVCLIGPSGSGKSTLLRSLNHLEVPTAGTVRLEGRPIGIVEGAAGRRSVMSGKQLAEMRGQIGMVFQLFYLWPHLTAVENVMLGLTEVRCMTTAEAASRANAMLRKVGLAERAGAYPEQLSGGQRQRVAIARALAMTPKIMLFDEPTSALDPELAGEVLATIEQVASEGMTMVIATHEMAFARKVADRILFIDDGTIVESGTPDMIFDHPQHDRLKRFLDKVQV
jgi:ABC-type polar amino acid transport system ATPase subunit